MSPMPLSLGGAAPPSLPVDQGTQHVAPAKEFLWAFTA